ncbi:DUF6090 family protein [Algoriphagus namhaensis]
MISLFRKIRQKLLSQNKVTRYLVYALGEILLVVIGILIALGVNNQNESRREAAKERQIIGALHSEFEENLNSLNYDIGRIKKMVSAQELVLSLINSRDLPSDEVLDSLLSLALINMTWNPSSYVLNDLKNSGQISKLSNPQLQSLLFGWERHYENVIEFAEDDLRSSNSMLEYIKENGSMRNVDSGYLKNQGKQYSRSTFEFSNSVLLYDINFENILDDKYTTSVLLLNQYESSIEIIENILKATTP